MASPHARSSCPALASALLLVACAAPYEPPPEAPRPMHEVTRWQVQRAGVPVGQVVLLENRDGSAPLRFYRIENARGQWVGFVDMAGRVWRRVPFRDDEFLGMHAMESAVALLYELEGPLALVPLDPDAQVPAAGMPAAGMPAPPSHERRRAREAASDRRP